MTTHTYKCQTCDLPGTFVRQGAGTQVIVLSCGHHYTFYKKSGDVCKDSYFPHHDLPPSEYLAKPDYGVKRPD